MHPQVIDWLRYVKSCNQSIFTGRRVLECGSLNVNGTPRLFFDGCEYIGIDWRDGPDVDVVCHAHEYPSDEYFDVVISTEMLEHDPYWPKSIANMVHVLSVGGHMLLTFGGIDRPVHELDTSPVFGYYSGLSSLTVYSAMLNKFRSVRIWDDGNDVYMWCEEKVG